MKVLARFMTSAASPAQFPTTTAPEFAFLGRSNVGKSSLLNSLTGTKLARVSNTPGRTQTVNFFAVDIGKERSEPEMIFSDLPGYGYAKAPLTIVGEWPKFIEPYLSDRETLKLCICLVDSNIPPQKSDMQLIDWLQKNDRSFVLVATKTDRISGNELTRSLKALTNDFGVKPLPYSAKTGKGRDDLWKLIRQQTSST